MKLARFLLVALLLGAAPMGASAAEPCGDLLEAAGDGDIRAMRSVLDQGVDVNCRDRGTGHTPLISAARNANPDAVRFLLRRGAVVNARDYDGNTALYHAKVVGLDAAVGGMDSVLKARVDVVIGTLEQAGGLFRK